MNVMKPNLTCVLNDSMCPELWDTFGSITSCAILIAPISWIVSFIKLPMCLTNECWRVALCVLLSSCHICAQIGLSMVIKSITYSNAQCLLIKVYIRERFVTDKRMYDQYQEERLAVRDRIENSNSLHGNSFHHQSDLTSEGKKSLHNLSRNYNYSSAIKTENLTKDYQVDSSRALHSQEEMNYGHFAPQYGQFPPQYYFPGAWPQNNQEQNHMLNHMQQHAAAANMYANSMYGEPLALTHYANETGFGEEECPQCSTKFIRSQGKFDPNNPKNMICASCFDGISATSGYPQVRNLKREKKVKTCPNCKTQTTSLWRKFKSADEVQRELEKKEGGKDREIDSSKPEFEGELGCNPCVLYWKLHGKHRPLELQRDGPLVTRKRKRKEKPFTDKYDHSLMHKQYNPMYWPVHQNNQSNYPFFQNNTFLTNNVYQSNMVPSEYLSPQARIFTPVDVQLANSAANSPCSSSSSTQSIKIDEVV